MLLVTGITGHTGRYFLQELIDHKYEGSIRCIVRETSDTSKLDNSELNIEKIYGDLNDGEFLKNVMQDIDVVLHIAGIQKTLKVVEAATSNKVEQVIFVHTTGIFSNFKSASEEYQQIEDEMKKRIELNNNLMSVTVLRPTMIYGDLCDLNMSKFIKMVNYLRIFPVINHGKSKIQPVNARDLGKAYFQVLVTSTVKLKSEYIVSGDIPITMIEAFKTISNKLDKKTLFISFPLSFGIFLAKALYLITLKRVNYIEKVQRMGEDRSFPHDDASNDFNYSPRTFDEGIELEVGQYVKKKRGK